ncbi:MAG: PIN domain-containing protein [Kiritimatiellae bacterium]|nr:PIN domain-containing protein [Kiritimatiellia bacterium]
MNILVDSSVWIAYFRGTENMQKMDFLIEEDLIVTNNLILAELIPHLYVQKERKLTNLLEQLSCFSLNTDWSNIIQMQMTCILNGINKMGIPDLLIAQNAIQNKLNIFTLDKHFYLMT